MSFIVEDGTGLSNATSYMSVLDADAYWADRGNAEWAALAPLQKQSFLISATEYIDLRWGDQLAGRRAFDTQALEFPRVALCSSQPVVPPIALPAALLKATAQYALIASSQQLAPIPELDSTGRYGTMVREKVGPIEEERRWGVGNTTPQVFPMYPIADSMMLSLLSRAAMASSGRVIR